MDLENYKRIEHEHKSIEKFCRLCFMDNSLLINIYEKVASDGLTISDVIVRDLDLEVYDDGLPNLVCSDCLEEVIQFDSIRSDVRETLGYMICRKKYMTMLSTKDEEDVDNPMQITQVIKYQHGRYNSHSFGEWSNVAINLPKEGITKLDVGYLDSRLKETGLTIGESSKCKKQTSLSKFFYHCRKCNKQFYDVNGVNQHFSIFHLNDKEYSCDRCEKRFIFKKDLVEHITKYEFQCLAKRFRMKEILKSDNDENVFKVNSNAEVLDVEQNEILKSPNTLVERNPSTLAIEYNDCTRYLCSHCGASFVGKELLKGHIYNCPNIAKEVKQDLPKKLFPLTSSHATNITLNPKNINSRIWYKCGKCNETFLDRKHVICHLKEKHNAERPCMCNMCNVGFCSRFELGNHHSVHKGQKPYTCKTCGAGFAVKYNLKNHVKSCEDKSVLFKCNFCGKCFGGAGGLKKHSVTHSLERKYLCQYCPCGFKAQDTLITHVRAKHLEIKPYQCGICLKAFAQRKSLHNHIAYHSDERPFVCDICERSFKLKHHHDKHKKTVHKTNIK